MELFRNPNNDYTEAASSHLSWLWCLLFGCIYFLARGNYRHMLLSFLFAVFTFGFSHLIYPFFVYPINDAYYLRKGWKKMNV